MGRRPADDPDLDRARRDLGLTNGGFGPESGALRDEFVFRLMRLMNAEVRQIEKERLSFVATDEVHRLVGEEVGEILVRRMVDVRFGLELEVLARRDDPRELATMALMSVDYTISNFFIGAQTTSNDIAVSWAAKFDS